MQPATNRLGDHVERLIGTMMGAVHALPGATFSTVKVRGDYDAEGGAVFTLRELEAWLALQIAGGLSPSDPHGSSPAAVGGGAEHHIDLAAERAEDLRPAAGCTGHWRRLTFSDAGRS